MSDDTPRRVTLSGKPPEPGHEHGGAPADIDPATGMHRDYWVLAPEKDPAVAEAIKRLRPLRYQYKHLICGGVTTMGRLLAETYQRDPSFYGSTFCVHCKGHFPVGEHGEFVWIDIGGATDLKVGT
jgi:hypothetical protein